jgi:triacylglycerol lipase
MIDDPIAYDPTRKALFTPADRPPIADFSVDWQLDQICAELSRLVYTPFEIGPEQEARLAAELMAAGFSKPQCFHDEETGSEALVTTMPDRTILVAFRGTQVTSVKDVVSDALIKLEEWPGPGLVHKGFWRAYRSLRQKIDDAIGDPPAWKLVVTGHSLGAAMATLMAALLPEAILVTFGSPRVGDRTFAKLFEGRDVRRYDDCTDIVARIPPPIGYAHVSEMRYIDHLGQVHSPPPVDPGIASDRLKGNHLYLRKYAWKLWSNVPARSGADHAPINYVSALLGRRAGP